MGSRELAVFATGTGLAALHVLDDAFVGKQPGTTAGEHVLAAIVVLAILAAALVVYPRLGAGARAVLAVGLGILIAVAGAMHVAHAVIDDAELSDFTGILAAVGGAAVVGLGIVVAWRTPASSSRRRRWARRAGIAIGALVVGFYVLFPIGAAIYITHTPREPIDEPFAVPHEEVSYETADGLTLRGWYAPRGTARRSSSSTAPAAAGSTPGSMPASSRSTATACSSTTPGAGARATGTRTGSTGRGSRTSTRPSSSCARDRTCRTTGSAGSASRREPRC